MLSFRNGDSTAMDSDLVLLCRLWRICGIHGWFGAGRDEREHEEEGVDR